MTIYEYIETEIQTIITNAGLSFNYLDSFDLDKWYSFNFDYIYMSISEAGRVSAGYENTDGRSISSGLSLRLIIGIYEQSGGSTTLKQKMYNVLQSLDLALNEKTIPFQDVTEYSATFEPVKINLIQTMNYNIEDKLLFDFVMTINYNRVLK